MKSIILLAALLAPTSSSAPATAANEALMDEIERQVQLPTDAEPLDHYGRYYRFAGKGQVQAVYMLPPERTTPDPRPADWGCEDLVLDGNALSTREVPCPPDEDISQFLRAGQRRWLADGMALPEIFDGGCATVNVRFNLETRKVEHAYCNGLA
jgi:hypothetical protein